MVIFFDPFVEMCLERKNKRVSASSWSYLWSIEILRINTSVFTVFMVIFFDPFVEMCLECKNERVSASSWFDGDNKSMFNVGLLLQDTSSKVYTKIVSVSTSNGSICVEINLNNSVLFSSIRKNAFQFVGAILLVCTFLLIPFPRFNLVWLFKLSFLYVSKLTKSTVKNCLNFLIFFLI